MAKGITVGSVSYPLIDDSNYQDYIGQGPVDGGYGLIPRDYDKVEYGAVPYAGPVGLPLIPPEEWFDRIADMERTKSRLSDIIDAVKVPKLYQNGVGYCHAFSAAHAGMCLRATMNEPFAKLSPSSVGGPITGYRNKGAWIIDDLKQAAEVGFAEAEYYPVLTTENKWTTEGKQSAERNKITEWWELKRPGEKDPNTGIYISVMEMMTCLLSRVPVPVGLNWWGHSVNYLDAVLTKQGVIGVLAQNSHSPDSQPDDGRLVLELIDLTNPRKPRYGKGSHDEAYSPRQMTPSQPL